ncbi:MAG: AEC family transporter [Rhodoferax sp.]|nr:AEC family transporter [Rhodoferax sp.]
MRDLFFITFPIYLVILIGYGVTRLGVFQPADLRALGQFVIRLALPALIFLALAQRPLADILVPGYLLAYLGGSLLALGLGWLWCRHHAGLDQTASAIRVMGMVCSNSGFVGYPILLLVLPSVAGVALAMNMVVENVLVIPLLLALAEAGRSPSVRWSDRMRQTVRQLAANPLILALAAGLTVSAMGWSLPVPLVRAVSLFALASSALSLSVIGGNLVGLTLRGVGSGALMIVVGKLLLHPAAVWLALAGLPWVGLPPLEPSLRHAALLLAAMPIMGIYPILAQEYGKGPLSAAAMLSTTVASFITVNALLFLLLGRTV